MMRCGGATIVIELGVGEVGIKIWRTRDIIVLTKVCACDVRIGPLALSMDT